MKVKSGLAFHVHHDKLYEWCWGYDERVACIKSCKPEREQELRLRLFKIIPSDRMPGLESAEWAAYDKARAAYDKAWAAYDKAWAAYVKAWAAYDKAWAAYVKARAAYDKAGAAYEKAYSQELEVLHKELCPDCPFDGRTIFSKEGK